MKRILFCFALMFSVLAFGQKVQQNQRGAKKMMVQYLGQSPKLTQIKPIPNRIKTGKSDVYIVPNKLTKTGLIKQIINKRKDPVIQKGVSTAARGLNEATVLTGFDGGSNQDNANVNGIQVAPPDTQGDVGPNHYIQMTNSVTTIFDKSGNALLGPVPNSVFFQNLDPVLAGTNDGDPVVLYDEFEDRWIVSQFAVSQGAPFAMLIAVSSTSDPLGTYNQYAISYGTDFPDYPKLGIWNDALYITTRDFANGQSFAGFSLVAINKFDMYDGVPTDAQRFEINNPDFDGILPADADGTTPPPPGEPHYSMYLSASGNLLNLITTTIDFDNPANSTLEFGTVPVAPYSFFQTQVDQPNGQTLDALPFFLMYRLQYRNFGTYQTMLTNHSVQEQSGGAYGIRWYEFRGGQGTWDVYQQGTYLPDDGLNRWMGSVAMNGNGDIALGYSVSSSTLNPSIRFAGQSSSESGSGILDIPETSILEGTFSSSGASRWGDYSMMSIDPVDQDFWFTTEYIAQDTAFSGWGTWIAELQLEQPLIAVSPGAPITGELLVGETLATDFTVTNSSENDVVVNVGATNNGLPISFTSDVLNIAAGGSEAVTATINTAGLAGGFFNEEISFTVEGTDEVERVSVSIRVLDGTEAPILEVSPTAFNESIEQFQIGTTDLLISNPGTDDLTFTISVNADTQAPFADRAAESANLMAAQGFTTKRVETLGSTRLSSLITTDAGSIQQSEVAVLTEGFETFTAGELDGQSGWITAPAGSFTVSADAAFEGSQGVDVAPTGTGAQTIALSPSITPGNQSFMTASAVLRLEGDDTNFEFIPQSPTAGSVNTRVRFNADGSIDVLDASTGAFVTTSATRPEGFFNLRMSIDRDNLAIRVFIDGELIHSGTGFAPTIEQVVFLSDNVGSASSFAFDNIEITDGDDDTFFLSVSPISGTVPLGGSLGATVRYDARDLEPGSYTANINITSNDPNTPSLDIPFNLQVLTPPIIAVNPDSLSESVDVQVDDPPTRTATFTISNNGESVLDFTTALGSTTFNPPALQGQSLASRITPVDMKKYGLGNPVATTMQSVKAKPYKASFASMAAAELLENEVFNDSIAYDSGIDFPDSFGGLNGAPIITAVGFDAETDFTLTAVRNAYQTNALENVEILLQVYRGGATPAEGELLLEQVTTTLAPDGIFLLEHLDMPLQFSAGERFWVVHGYEGIDFPQGQDDDTSNVRPNTYFFSSDGGQTYTNLDNFVFLTRALSGDTDGGPYITLNPTSGTVAAGESIDVEVTFDGAALANGTYNTDILVNSNDPVTPTATVATTFAVSGQTSVIDVSDELLLFNNVFLGDSGERILTITNNGLSTLNISSLSTDNPDFTVATETASIEAGESLEVAVTFTPSATGSINGILNIASDATNASSVDVILNGVGVDPPIAVLDPAEVSATTDAGTTVEAQITLRNDGNSPLQFSFPDLAVAAARANPNIIIAKNAEFIQFEGYENAEKGFTDNRVGAEVPFGLGTDNDFGYTWIDSDEPDGPIYGFFDITGIGTDITGILGGDGTASGPIGFPFEFYGATYEELFINANGFVSFQAPTVTNPWVNRQIPAVDGVDGIIAGLWADLEPQNFNGSVHIAGGPEVLIVQWTNASLFFGSADETVTFQIVLFADGNIEIYYEDVETAPFRSSSTVGIESIDGTDGAQVAFNTPYIKDGLVVRFVKPSVGLTPFISSVSPLSGVVAAGGSRELSVTLDATNLNDGVFFDELTVSSNSPDKSNSTSLFELTVIGTPEIAVDPDTLEFDPIFVGLSSELTVNVSNVGTKDLEISDITNNNTDYQASLGDVTNLAPGESALLTITFTPTSVGEITDEITISSTDGVGNESLAISVTGVGVDPPVLEIDPEEISVTLVKGQSTTEDVTLTNTGGSPLSYVVVAPADFTAEGTLAPTVASYDQLEFEPLTRKDQVDNRVGQPFRNASGGPDTFGYTFVDSNSGGPTFDFIDISTTGTLANTGQDGQEEGIPLPFEFPFYGEMQSSINIDANGYVSFSPITNGIDFINSQIPNTGNPNNLIAIMWDDIEPLNGTGVFYEGNSERFIVQYEATPRFLEGIPLTFQLILYPNGSFKMQYADVSAATTTSSTVGIESPDGTFGLQVIFNSAYLEDNLAVTFSPPAGVGVLAPGESVAIPIDISAQGLEANTTYTAEVIVNSNDPLRPVESVPITLEVLDAPEVVSFTLINAATNEEIGSLNEGDVIDLNNFEGLNAFNVVANIGDLPVSSVVFDFNDQEGFRTENVAPYALGGDSGGGTNFNPVAFNVGDNTVTATPFDGRNGNGTAGIALTVNFSVIDSGMSEVTSFSLVNAQTNEIIGELTEGAIIDLSLYDANSFNVIANVSSARTRSVVFDFNGVSNFRTENAAPYTLGGDSGRGTNFRPLAFPVGLNTLTATPYDGRGGNGTSGNSLSLSFEVVENQPNPTTEGVVYPNPVEDIATISLEGYESSPINGAIYSMSGFMVYSPFTISLDEDGKGTINMGSLPQGTYILRLTDAKGNVMSPIKIQRK